MLIFKRINAQDCITDWLDYLDDLIGEADTELWQNRKVLVLDSIEVLNYIRENTSNTSIEADSRVQYLFDLCQLPCRNDYYHRFLSFNNAYYGGIESNWWVDCWQTIRMKNLLHKFGLIDLNFYLSEESDGKEFSRKWRTFYLKAKQNKEENVLAAFSYLECIRFSLNLHETLGSHELDDIKTFLKKIYEKEGEALKYFEFSNEIRANSLNLIRCLENSYSDTEYKEIYSEIKRALIEMLNKNSWDQFSFTWCTFFLYELDEDILIQTRLMIPKHLFVEYSWISGRNHTRKPRYSLLASLEMLENHDYFEVIKPNSVVYTPYYKRKANLETITVMDKAIQALKTMEDIQLKLSETKGSDTKYNETYFRDLLRLALCSNKSDNVEYIEKESLLSSGRTTDLLIVSRDEYDIPVEFKILWRFQGESYEPINEVLEQLTDGNFGIIIVINPHKNPTYKKKYTGFDGWKSFVKDHDTYIKGSIHEKDSYYGSLKSHSVYSEHMYNYGARQKLVTLLSIMIDLSEYVKSPHLK